MEEREVPPSTGLLLSKPSKKEGLHWGSLHLPTRRRHRIGASACTSQRRATDQGREGDVREKAQTLRRLSLPLSLSGRLVFRMRSRLPRQEPTPDMLQGVSTVPEARAPAERSRAVALRHRSFALQSRPHGLRMGFGRRTQTLRRRHGFCDAIGTCVHLCDR